MVSSLEFAFGPDGRVRPVMEEAVRQGAADTLVEEGEEQGDLHALGGQAIGVILSSEALHVANGNDIFSIGGRGEVQE